MYSHVPKNPGEYILDYLREIYAYENGKVFRIDKNYCAIEVGSYSTSKERITVTISRGRKGSVINLCRTHIVWFLCKDEWPTSEIDHKDRDRCNDNIDNLRYADRSLQNSNRVLSNKNNLRGVNKVTDTCYQAQIWYKGKRYILGSYLNAAAAHKAYRIKYKELHGIEFEQ